MRVCLVTEKHVYAVWLIEALHRRYPALDPQGFACAFVSPYTHLNPEFALPRNLAWRDYPFSGEPAYRPFAMHPQGCHPSFRPRFTPETKPAGVEDGYRVVACDRRFDDPEGEAMRRFMAADVIHVALDAGESEALAVDRLARHLGPACSARIRISPLRSTDPDSLDRAIASPEPLDGPWMRTNLGPARVRRRFDYGFTVNALAVLRRTMTEAGAPADARVPSKFGLQALYHLRRDGPLSRNDWHESLSKWRGTGRYEDAPGYRPGYPNSCGSPPAITALPGVLGESGLVAQGADGRIGITALGLRFLDRLHPACEDRDLPFRLNLWKALPEEEGNAKVDRYLEVFFRRQIRFLARPAQPHVRSGAA